MPKKSLYFECFSGISGDMTAAALLDLGVDEGKLLSALDSLPLSGYRVKITDVKKSEVHAKDFDVILEEENHDHDMNYLYGHLKDDAATEESVHTHMQGHPEHGMHHEDMHGHEHGHEHEHTHDHGHDHEHGHPHHHMHRGMKEIREIIAGSALTEGAKEIMTRIFNKVAEAEATVHETTVEEVHFHEVGAVDSIVDVAAIAVCLDELGIEEIIPSVIYEGQGTVRCQHGILPVPVPAVTEILRRSGLKMHVMPVNGEFITPTGAAVLAAMSTKRELPESYEIKRIGVGAGKRVYEGSGVLRVMLIES